MLRSSEMPDCGHRTTERHHALALVAGQLEPVSEFVVGAAQKLLGATQLRHGFWFNEMHPGHRTTLHSHEELDELLSAVYYVSCPDDSGRLILHDDHALHAGVVGDLGQRRAGGTQHDLVLIEMSFDAAEEKLKSQYSPDRLPAYTRHLFQAFNSRPFILFLEEMTGIKGLIPDPYYIGAGIHKTLNGGYLNIHADCNVHGQVKLERGLNVLIYLNPPWKEEWGGSFEVWDKPMKNKVASFAPTENRMCCFSTGSDTWHGNPEPVNHPDGLPRLSIAL